MRYFYEPPTEYDMTKAKTYKCNHRMYSKCTLYEFGGEGLAVVQKRFNSKLKVTWWGPIDPWLVDDIFSQPGFWEVFSKYADRSSVGIFPTISVRKLMWELRMKPIKREFWEDDI
jgi:hypothetical protein